MVSKENRRGKSVLVIDISYSLPDGSWERYRRLAQVQLMTSAREEDRRLVGVLATAGRIPGAKPIRRGNNKQAVSEADPVVVPVRSEEMRPPVVPTSHPQQVERPAESVARPALPGLAKRDKDKADPDTLTFGAAVEVWRKLGAPKIKATTLVGYNKNLKAYLMPRFEHTRMMDLDRATLAPFEASLVEAGLSDQTRNNIMVTLRSIVRFNCDLNDWVVPRWSKLLPIKIKHYDPPTPREIKMLIEAALAPETKLAVGLAAYAGLRVGEVLGLRPVDVDLRRDTLTVRQTLYNGKVDTPKSGHERQIPLAPVLHRMLEEASGSWTRTTERVIAPGGKLRWSSGGLRYAFLKTLKGSGIPRHRFHGLRHFFITLCFEGGADAPTVQKLAGHGHLSVTQRYAHTNDSRLRKAVQIFG